MVMKLAKLKAPPITAWSFSRLNDWEECPLRARFKYVEKLATTQNPAMARGDKMHKGVEAYTKSVPAAKLPDEAKFFKTELAVIKKEVTAGTSKPEFKLTFDRLWKRVDWFAKNAYVRIMADCMRLGKNHVKIVDYKSGKLRDNKNDTYIQQLELYTVGALTAGLGKTANGELWFTDHGVIVGADGHPLHRVVKLAELPKLQAKWDKRAAPMLADTTFRANPGYGCNWCDFSQKKGGQCQY